MARMLRVVAATFGLLLLAAGAARGHSEEMSPAELLETVAAAGAPALTQPDATLGAPPASKAATPVAWYSRAPVAARFGSSDDDAYSLAGGCFRVRPAGGDYLTRSGDEYVTGARAGDAEVFRFQATGLGSYLLLDSDGGFAAATADGPGVLEEPAGRAEWTVSGSEASGYQIVAPTGQALGIDRDGGLELGGTEAFELQGAPTCMSFPEIAVNATGRPYRANPRYGEASGTIDLHSHIMAFEAFGKGLHCGRPWSPLGVADALKDCAYHAPNGIGALETNMLVFQDPLRMHAPDGWPAFTGWPTKDMDFGHEQTYYRWIERAWRGGLRLVTLLAVDNSAACLVNTHKTESCNEMAAVRRQIADTKELQAYIDAQAGGPGKGFFQIVRNPFQARKVINNGKLAVILGIEVSEPLDCGIRNGVSQCDEADVDEELDAVYRSGVRQMEIVNKFDNAFTGVAMDGGFQGPFINSANKQVTGEFWDVETCTGSDEDRTQPTSVPPEAAALIALLPGGAAPGPYPPPPHCNTRGLTELGRYLIRAMAKRKMIFDPDHMSVYARRSALDLVDALDYSGIVSSHSWADRTSYKRIMELGGVVAPMAPDADDFDDSWASQRELYRDGKRRSRKYGFGFGFGDDMNGFGGPREPTGGTDAEISYPFSSPIHPSVRLSRQQSGTRTFDLNTDGIAHFGQWPDWTEGVRRDGGSRVIRDLRGGAESYLRMWERAVGIRGPHRKSRHAHFKPSGVKRIKLGMRPKRLLRAAGQPDVRTRGWRWRARGARGTVGAAFAGRRKVGLVAATARGYRAAGIHRGTSASRLAGFAKPLGAGIWVRDASKASRFFYRVRGGKVRFVGVGTDQVTHSPKRIKRLARRAVGR